MKKTVIRTGKNVFWGVVLIAAAILIVIDAVGIGVELPLIKIAAGVLLAAWFVREIIKLNVKGIFFPLALAFMVFEKEIGAWCGRGENIISNWLLLLVAALLTFGTQLLFGDKVPYFSAQAKVNVGSNSNLFGEAVKYIDCTDFSVIHMSNKFGEYNVYFQNTDAYTGGSTLDVSNHFGEMNIYVPSDWKIEWKVISSFGEAGIRGTVNEFGKVLIITGNSSFGEVNVHTV